MSEREDHTAHTLRMAAIVREHHGPDARIRIRVTGRDAEYLDRARIAAAGYAIEIDPDVPSGYVLADVPEPDSHTIEFL